MQENIDIITVCYNSSHFVSNIIHSIKYTASYDFRVVVVDNGSDSYHQDKLDKIASSENAVLMRRRQSDANPGISASRHHGEAIQHAVTQLPKNNIGIVVDCDSCFIRKNWDREILCYLNEYQHVTCERPGVKYGCGAWFSAFRINTILENDISFLPVLKPNGTDCPRPNLYDVGSDLDRVRPWKKIHKHHKWRFHSHGHVWMLDGIPFLDHMGACRSFDEFNAWKKWLDIRWKVSNKYD